MQKSSGKIQEYCIIYEVVLQYVLYCKRKQSILVEWQVETGSMLCKQAIVLALDACIFMFKKLLIFL